MIRLQSKNEIQKYFLKEQLLKRIAVEHNVATGLVKIKKDTVQRNLCKTFSFFEIYRRMSGNRFQRN